jgi:signal transduction histidine kinase
MTASDGEQWRISTVRLRLGLRLEVGTPVSAITAPETRLRNIVIGSGLLGMLIVFIGTLVTTRLALRPLNELSAAAAAVKGTTDLKTRVHDPGQPPEVGRLARELDHMLERLEEAVEAREAALLSARRFAADAGHELRAPLQSVRANLDIARSANATLEQRQRALEDAEVQCERLNRLVDGLQTLARGESDITGPAREVDVGDIADATVYATRTRHPGISIETDLPSSGPVVKGDPDGLWRALENLLENAARHGRDGGHVRVSVAGCDPGRAKIVVEDDGPGIPEHERTRVVARFARGSGTTAAGSGLGLAIVEAEARRHGGALTLSRSPLGGLLAELVVGDHPDELN